MLVGVTSRPYFWKIFCSAPTHSGSWAADTLPKATVTLGTSGVSAPEAAGLAAALAAPDAAGLALAAPEAAGLALAAADAAGFGLAADDAAALGFAAAADVAALGLAGA